MGTKCTYKYIKLIENKLASQITFLISQGYLGYSKAAFIR